MRADCRNRAYGTLVAGEKKAACALDCNCQKLAFAWVEFETELTSPCLKIRCKRQLGVVRLKHQHLSENGVK